jgi:hypothetical protein
MQQLRPNAQCTTAVGAFAAMTKYAICLPPQPSWLSYMSREVLSLRQEYNDKLRKIHDVRCHYQCHYSMAAYDLLLSDMLTLYLLLM